MPSKKHLNRRNFLKLTSGAALVMLGPKLVFASDVPARCAHCEIDLAAGKLMTKLGKCRNCGADVRVGVRELPPKIFRTKSKKAIAEFRDGVELPFPHPEIQSMTKKPCGVLADIRSKKSKVREARLNARG